MTQGKRMTTRDLLTETHFGDGPPHWRLNAGKAWACASRTGSETTELRDVVARKLEWHGHKQGGKKCLQLATLLRSCREQQRCFSGACPICTRALQRWFVTEDLRLDARIDQGLEIVSLVPDFGQARCGSLAQLDWSSFQAQARHALRRVGIRRILAGVDVSLNHSDGCPGDAVFQFQLWGPFEEPSAPWREELKRRLNLSGSVARPVLRFTPDRPRASLAYAVKEKFKRRVSFVDNSPGRKRLLVATRATAR
jgi:hypothetical protein